MKNGVYFTTNTLQDLNQEFDKSTQTYNKTQSGLVDEVVTVACKFFFAGIVIVLGVEF
jgi:hypothetical protein